MADYRIDVEERPSEENIQTVVRGLVRFNDTHAEPEHWRRLGVFVRDASGTVVGGLVGYTHWGWLFVSHVWVPEALHGRGYGTALLRMAEGEAIRRGCRQAHLDTFDFQARGFYERLGYEVFGVLDDYPAGHTRYFLRKRTLGID
jgi:ribosomal protein S18 acetylase RimI-like enzyme